MTLRTSRDISALEGFLARYGDMPTEPAFRAAISLEQNDVPSMIGHAEKCPTMYNPSLMGPWQRGSVTLMKSEHRHLHFKPHYDIETVDRCGNSAGFACVFSADSNYFKRFFEMSVTSFGNRHHDGMLVYHLVNPDDECFELIGKFAGQHKNVLILKSEIQNPQKADFASARFFAARQILHELDLPVFIFDIDLVFAQNLADVLGKNWDYNKLGLRVSPVFTLPWQKVTVNFVYAPNSSIGRRFLDNTCAHLKHEFDRQDRGDIWWVDQNAALFAFLQLSPDEWQQWGPRAKRLAIIPELHKNRDQLLRNAYQII